SPVLGPPLYIPGSISGLSMGVKDIYDILHGGEIPEFSPVRGTFINVRDMADLVLRAIEKGQDHHMRYTLVGGSSSVSPQGISKILRARYPERKGIIQLRHPGESVAASIASKFDASEAQGLLGRDWIGFEKSVVDSVEMFL
ncbi:hypothetical protein B0T25DRAFT_422747, partial [Lasiosphaeria hispida]